MRVHAYVRACMCEERIPISLHHNTHSQLTDDNTLWHDNAGYKKNETQRNFQATFHKEQKKTEVSEMVYCQRLRGIKT